MSLFNFSEKEGGIEKLGKLGKLEKLEKLEILAIVLPPPCAS